MTTFYSENAFLFKIIYDKLAAGIFKSGKGVKYGSRTFESKVIPCWNAMINYKHKGTFIIISYDMLAAGMFARVNNGVDQHGGGEPFA